MESRYNESAKHLAQQKKERMRVIRRRKVVHGIATGVLVTAMSVGMAFIFTNSWDREFEANQQMVAEFRAENYHSQISDEEIATADKEYVEDHYSAETIGNLTASTVSEYGVLIDAIVENEKLQVNSNVKALDSDRLDKAITSYGEFKASCEQDKMDYATASEEDRINKASSLYNTKREVLKNELIEVNQKSKYLVKDSAEYTKNQEEIENITRKINTIQSALDVVTDRSMTIYFEKQPIEEGKQR